MCNLWKLAANSREFHKLKFIRLYDKAEPVIERLSFEDFMNILKVVAPELRFAQIERCEHEGQCENDFLVQFGRFKYIVTFEKKQQNTLMNVFVDCAKNVTTLNVNSFAGVTKQDWTKFFQVNQVKNFYFEENVCKNEGNSFFHDYIHTLPHTVENIGMDVSYADQKQLLLIQEVIEFLFHCLLKISHCCILSVRNV